MPAFAAFDVSRYPHTDRSDVRAEGLLQVYQGSAVPRFNRSCRQTFHSVIKLIIFVHIISENTSMDLQQLGLTIEAKHLLRLLLGKLLLPLGLLATDELQRDAS